MIKVCSLIKGFWKVWGNRQPPELQRRSASSADDGVLPALLSGFLGFRA